MISQWELGKRPIKPETAAYLLGLCKTSMPEANRVLELLEPPSDLYWVRPGFSKLADPIKSLTIQENMAEAMYCFDPMWIPGLLQIEGYARAMFEDEPRYSQEKIDLLVASRLDRQRLLQRPLPVPRTPPPRRPTPPRCMFFIHERTLRTTVGSYEIMHDQLHNLLHSFQHCAIRVVPEASTVARFQGAPFRIMEFADGPALVYTETYAANLFIEDRPAVEAFYNVVACLEQTALAEGQSREWLIQLADEYERMRE